MTTAIRIQDLGKMYKLYNKPIDKAIEAFGLDKFLFWRKNNNNEFWALRGLNLEVKKGERLGIIGRNGAGKSTLLKIISGNLSPTEGIVEVNGNIQALMELGTGFHPEFTGRENIHASLSYNGLTSREIKKYEEEIIDFTELEEFIDQPIKVYSAGMYARLAFAVSTVLNPEVLIIDEILGAGDASFARKCSLRIQNLTKESGVTVLFVSHSMESVLEMCDRAILINRGTITHDADPLTISKIYNDMIRKEDELVLRAKESRLRKKDYRSLTSISDDFEPLLFRLKTDTDHPKDEHLIYSIKLKHDEEIAGEINVGAPMDNDLNQYNRIIDGLGMMDWSKSKKVGNKFCRAYRNEEGSYCHAPFQLCIPKYLLNENLILEIECKISSKDNVYIELWKEDGYEHITKLNPEKRIQVIPVSININQSPKEDVIKDVNPSNKEIVESNDLRIPEEISSIESTENKYSYENLKENLSIYGSQEIIISNIELLDDKSFSKRVFTVGEKLIFKIDISSKIKVDNYVIVVSILEASGKPVGQVYCSSSDLDLDGFIGNEVIYLEYSPLRFGYGEYVASVGLFKEYDLLIEKENEAYCVVDRGIFFKVQQPIHVKKGLGNFVHPVIWRNEKKTIMYDATKHLNDI